MTCPKRPISGAPMVFFRYTQDLSNAVVPFERTPLPQHLPIFYLQTKSGKTGRTVVGPSEASSLYGIDSFDLNGLYANHQTFGINTAFANANVCMIHRISNGTHSNMVFCLDVARVDDIPIYIRDVDTGEYVLDGNGDPQVDGANVTTGFNVKWVLKSYADFAEHMLADGNGDPQAFHTFGQLPEIAGSMINSDGSPSRLYPIMQFAYNFQGKVGNNFGLKFWAQTSQSDNVNEDDVAESRIFPYRFSVVTRESELSSPYAIESLYSEGDTGFSFSTTAVEDYSGVSLHLEDIMASRYSNTIDETRPLRYGQFDDFTHVYQDNVERLLEEFTLNELAYLEANPTISSSFPFDTTSYDETSTDRHIFNLISGLDYKGVNYHTFEVDKFTTIVDSVQVNKFTNHFAKNGADNLMSVEDYESAVRVANLEYSDCDSEVMDMAVNPESILYDTGFTHDTKRELIKFISVRPDTYYVAGTHIDEVEIKGYVQPAGTTSISTPPALTLAEEIGLATSLTTRFNNYPESEYFGTSVVRGLIYGGSAYWRNSPWKRRVSFVMDLIDKASAMMGASNGIWDITKKFSRAPGNIVSNMYGPNIPWVSPSNRITNWDIGLNLPLMFDPGVLFTPGLQGVYSDDTSVLNSFKMGMVICTANKIAHRAWRQFAGADDLTDGELVFEVNKYVREQADGIFAGEATLNPDAYLTTNDVARGYSLTLALDVATGNMRTVFTVFVRARRLADV